MMSTRLGCPNGGKKTKVVLFSSAEGSSGLVSYPTIIGASIFCFLVLPVLVFLETSLALWVEITPVFRYCFRDFISGTFLPPKRSEGTLVERSNLDLMHLPFGSLGLFMKENKKKKKKLPLGLGESVIADAQVLTSRVKVPPPPI
jgi:hypothetical protein